MFKISKELLDNIHKGPVILGKNLPPVIVKFNYVRKHGSTHPALTVCTLITADYKTIAEGFAICSEKDNFSKSFGRELSLYRAVKALTSKRISLGINNNRQQLAYKSGIRYKAVYYPPEES